MQRTPLLILAFIITIVAVEIPAFSQESTSRDDTSPNSEGRKLNLIEPAAGQALVPVPDPNPYTNPDQEQLNENKKDWWDGWTPPEENNPYHKW